MVSLSLCLNRLKVFKKKNKKHALPPKPSLMNKKLGSSIRIAQETSPHATTDITTRLSRLDHNLQINSFIRVQMLPNEHGHKCRRSKSPLYLHLKPALSCHRYRLFYNLIWPSIMILNATKTIHHQISSRNTAHCRTEAGHV